tara:strand:- start:105 stop:1319 length:1215 start_codon:yes stop_codon:yes gene_type:complete
MILGVSIYNSRVRGWSRTLLFAVSVLCLHVSLAEAKSQAVWGGVSIEKSAIPSAPVAADLLSGADGRLDIEARRRIREKPFKNIEFISRVTGKQQEAVIVTASIARESLEIFKDLQASTPTYYHTYRIFLNLMAFDWDDTGGQKGRYIASVPFVIDFLDAKGAPASKEEKRATFTSMYLDNNLSGINVFDELYKASSHLVIDGDSEKFPQIAKFVFNAEVLETLGGEDAFASSSHILRQFFEAQVVKASGAVLVPAMDTKRANQEFKFVFSDRSQAIVLPEPLGEIVVKIERIIPFTKVVDVQKTLCFGAVIKIFVYDELGDILMERKFARTSDACFVTHKDNIVNPIRYFVKNLLLLLKKTADQFGGSVDRAWLEKMGVPSEMIPLYGDEIKTVKRELLKDFR